MTTTRSAAFTRSSGTETAGAAFRRKYDARSAAAKKDGNRNLELTEDGVGLAHRDVARRKATVRAGCDDDHVLALPVDDDRGDAAGTVVDADAAHVNTFGRKRVERRPVRSNSADEVHVRAEARRSYRLVCAFASRDSPQLRAADSLAGAGQAAADRDEVDVCRPDDGDPWTHRAVAVP